MTYQTREVKGDIRIVQQSYKSFLSCMNLHTTMWLTSYIPGTKASEGHVNQKTLQKYPVLGLVNVPIWYFMEIWIPNTLLYLPQCS